MSSGTAADRSDGARPRGRPRAEDRLGRAVDYLEERLFDEPGEPLAAGAAAAAGWSEWHFMRLFRAASGKTVAEYLRGRRLSRAALGIASGKLRISDAAAEAGYESRTAFVRAFAKEFGLSPRAYGKAHAGGEPRGLVHPFEPRLPFEPPEPEVAIEELPALALAGIAARIRSRSYAGFREIPELWKDWSRRRRWRELPGAPPGRPCYGVCVPSDDASFEYLICVEAPRDLPLPPRWRRIEIPSGRYAVSRACGDQPRAIQGATLATYSRWLPGSGYSRGSGPDVEVYLPGDMRLCEVRVPLA